MCDQRVARRAGSACHRDEQAVGLPQPSPLRRALFPRPQRAPPTTERSNRFDTRRSTGHPAVFHRRNKLDGTSHRPSRPARGIARVRRCAAASMRHASVHRGGLPAERRPTASHEKPAEPDTFTFAPSPDPIHVPSFQSPVPIRGRPWLPTGRLVSRARAQCSKSVPCSCEIVG